jgi:hypothetical protein
MVAGADADHADRRRQTARSWSWPGTYETRVPDALRAIAISVLSLDVGRDTSTRSARMYPSIGARVGAWSQDPDARIGSCALG